MRRMRMHRSLTSSPREPRKKRETRMEQEPGRGLDSRGWDEGERHDSRSKQLGLPRRGGDDGQRRGDPLGSDDGHRLGGPRRGSDDGQRRGDPLGSDDGHRRSDPHSGQLGGPRRGSDDGQRRGDPRGKRPGCRSLRWPGSPVRAPKAVAATVILLALLFISLQGCMVGPSYRRPSGATPAFKEPPPADWQMAQPRDQLRRGKWWEIFGDPQLNALEEQVAAANQSVAQAEAQFRAARAAAGIARAGLFPTVTAGGSVTNSRAGASRGGGTTPGTGTTGGTGSTGTTGGTGSSSSASSSTTTAGTSSGSVTTFQVPVDVSWEIDVWGRVRRQIEANVATAQATAADLENLRLSLQAELAADWFELHGLDAQQQLLAAAAGAYQTALKVTANRHDQGIASSP